MTTLEMVLLYFLAAALIALVGLVWEMEDGIFLSLLLWFAFWPVILVLGAGFVAADEIRWRRQRRKAGQ